MGAGWTFPGDTIDKLTGVERNDLGVLVILTDEPEEEWRFLTWRLMSAVVRCERHGWICRADSADEVRYEITPAGIERLESLGKRAPLDGA